MENRIKEIRKEKGITQTDLALRLGVTQGAVQKLETGANDLSAKMMERIAVILNVKPADLLPKEWQSQSVEDYCRDLITVIAIVEEWLITHKKTLQPKTKAELISSLLEVAASESDPDKKKAKLIEFADFAIKHAG